MIVHYNNQSVLHLAKKPIFHAQTKHMDVQYHFIRRTIEDGLIILQKIHTNENIEDILTKHILRL
jgi:hypothetical protein